MKILYRFGYYLAGLSIGLVFLAFIFNGKKTSCNYSPSARVKNNLLQKKIEIPIEIQKQFPKITDSLLRIYIEQGDIVFSKSNTKKDSCRLYYIEIEPKSSGAFEVNNCKETLNLVSFRRP